MPHQLATAITGLLELRDQYVQWDTERCRIARDGLRSRHAWDDSDEEGIKLLRRFAIAIGMLVPDDEDNLDYPAVWSELAGLQILDPDGWRGRDGRPMDEPITRAEFDRRAAISTINHRLVAQ